jgi:capreomycidine synthase
MSSTLLEKEPSAPRGAGRYPSIAPALLEDWLRDYYFSAEIDISSSGVENFSMAELRELLPLGPEELDSVVFDDSPSRGSDALRRAIAERWAGGDAARVMATHGSSEIIFLIMSALLREGDEVVILDPCYHALRNLAEAAGCELKIWRLDFERGFAADVEELKRLISPRTRMVVVNFPHNPTGTTVTAEEQRQIIEAAAGVGAYLVWDAAFNELTHDGEPLANPSLLYDRAITLGTLSKGYGLAGLRVGWCVAPPELLAGFVHWRDYTTLYLSPLVEAVARRAVERADALLAPRLERARRNLDLVAAWVADNSEHVEWVRPRGGVTAFLRLRRVEDVETFCHRLVRERGTLLIPGVCFDRPEHVRLGFGGPTAELAEGLARLSSQLREAAAETESALPVALGA